MNVILAILAALSIWDYPARYATHEQLRAQFVAATRSGDTAMMEEMCRKGVELLPDDPTWHYNLACALAYFPKRVDEAFSELEKAIYLGFRNADAIAADTDLKRLKSDSRLAEMISYAKDMSTKQILTGPLATVDATGIFGQPIALGEQNLSWNFDFGLFEARLRLATGRIGPWTGDLYMNRDGGHSVMNLQDFPGITEVKFDSEGRRRRMDLDTPNTIFPYPVFGNCSRALVGGPFWRSIPRTLVTLEASRLKAMERLYLANQIWVFPSNADTAPVGTNGDVFASITPYWLTTAGKSYSDRPYLKAALLASGALKKEVKGELLKRGLLAPTLMTLLRKSLVAVHDEEEYVSYRAHPTAMPPNGVDTNRLVRAAAALTVASIPPPVTIVVEAAPVKSAPVWPELTYRTHFAWGYVLRADEVQRTFIIQAAGAKEFRFAHTHGRAVEVKIEPMGPAAAKVTLDRTKMSPIERVDIAVFGRNPGTGWGPPSYVSFARMDQDAPYSDPFLTPRKNPTAEQ